MPHPHAGRYLIYARGHTHIEPEIAVNSIENFAIFIDYYVDRCHIRINFISREHPVISQTFKYPIVKPYTMLFNIIKPVKPFNFYPISN